MERNNSLEALLKPSLLPNSSSIPSYSVTSHFLMAFLGGPMSITAFSIYSTHRIGKLKSYLWLLIPLIFISLGIFFARLYQEIFGWPESMPFIIDDPSMIDYLSRGLGLGIFGIIYFFQRRLFNVSSLISDDTPSPWIPGIVILILVTAVQFVAAFVMVAVNR